MKVKQTYKNARELCVRVPVTFETREDAEIALKEIKNYLFENNYVSERELFGAIFTLDSHSLEKLDCEKKMWMDIVNTYIAMAPDGFSIFLPRPDVITAV